MRDIRPYGEYDKFMKVCCRPSKGICCKALTLKFGVLLTGILDIVLGILRLFDLLLIIQHHINYLNTTVTAFIVLNDIVSIVAIPFGYLGIRGINKQNLTRVHVYSIYKQAEALALFFFTFIFYFFVICPNFDCDMVLFFGIWCVRSAYNFYLSYIVWSADIRLANNEELLVMHGEQVVQIMNQQSNSLAAAQFAMVPGQTVPQIALGMPVKLA
mmetsp:Transcript_32187/g.55600  ORF Transcript_32187/g.55600 Transcript_32187/m.55600 type:complete len:214 (-) Transcript_32187:5404-6045(-)